MSSGGQKEKTKTGARKRSAWLSFAIVVLMTGMLFVTINYRSFSQMRAELQENATLTDQIQNLTDENLQLQDEIHSLKTDPNVIEREARRLGICVKSLSASTQVSVPAK